MLPKQSAGPLGLFFYWQGDRRTTPCSTWPKIRTAVLGADGYEIHAGCPIIETWQTR